jgi:hypothetical protein
MRELGAQPHSVRNRTADGGIRLLCLVCLAGTAGRVGGRGCQEVCNSCKALFQDRAMLQDGF